MEFQFLTSPRILFGPGTAEQLAEVVPALGARPLLLLGQRSAEGAGLRQQLERWVQPVTVGQCGREPTVQDVDRVVARARAASCDVVVAAGGGSVLDCGKAAAAMITNPGSLEDYLEGVGTGRELSATPCAMVALPTTSGTGSEVTKNAVISGPGYKKSIRSPEMIPRVAIVDPRLTRSMPPAVTAACGMDALVQLMESYLSRGASPLTDGLALQGVDQAGRGMMRAYEAPEDDQAREAMSLASLLGGVCLANAGLGAVHGLASPLGALFPVPHGVACAALLPQVMQANLEASRGAEAEQRVWSRFERLVSALGGETAAMDAAAGLELLEQLQRRLNIPRLAELGLTRDDFARVVAGARGSSMRYNPVELTDMQLTEILEAAF